MTFEEAAFAVDDIITSVVAQSAGVFQGPTRGLVRLSIVCSCIDGDDSGEDSGDESDRREAEEEEDDAFGEDDPVRARPRHRLQFVIISYFS